MCFTYIFAKLINCCGTSSFFVTLLCTESTHCKYFPMVHPLPLAKLGKLRKSNPFHGDGMNTEFSGTTHFNKMTPNQQYYWILIRYNLIWNLSFHSQFIWPLYTWSYIMILSAVEYSDVAWKVICNNSIIKLAHKLTRRQTKSSIIYCSSILY